MKKTSVVLVFDIGTQSTRALLVSSEGKILAKAQKGHHPAYVSRKSGWAEQDPDFYYQNLCRVSRQLRESFPDIFAQIRAVTLTTIRCTSVCLGRDGEPLRPAILWLDQRRASGTPALKPWISAAVKAVGMTKTLNLQYQKSHCNWIRENEPDIWAKTKKYVLLSAYLNYRLTGRLADSTASIVGYVPYDFKNRCWKKKNDLVRPVFDIPDEMMRELVDPGDYIGSLTETAAEDLGLNKDLKLIDVYKRQILTRKQTKDVKAKPPKFKFIAKSSPFDYLDLYDKKFYTLNFRVVRFAISEDSYESIITNLPKEDFPVEEIKKVYAMRWGIETSFRELKYAIG